MPKVSLIIPSRRPDKLVETVESIKDTSTRRDVEIVVVTDTEASKNAVAGMKAVKHVHLPVMVKAAIAWNEGAKAATGYWLSPAADDLFFYPGWWEALAPNLDASLWDVIGFNDLSGSDNPFATHYVMSIEFATHVLGGVIAPPVYMHAYTDVEVCQRAVDRGRFLYLDNCHVEHRHWVWSKAEKDDTYQDGVQSFEQDRANYIYRRSVGFPNVWHPVIGNA